MHEEILKYNTPSLDTVMQWKGEFSQVITRSVFRFFLKELTLLTSIRSIFSETLRRCVRRSRSRDVNELVELSLHGC